MKTHFKQDPLLMLGGVRVGQESRQEEGKVGSRTEDSLLFSKPSNIITAESLRLPTSFDPTEAMQTCKLDP